MPTLTLISDTHGYHDHVKVPSNGNILIHCGDSTRDIGQLDLRRFLVWFERQPQKHKVLIAGNHDGAFQLWPDLARAMVKEIAPSVTYLQDEAIEIDGLKIYGAPWTPTFFNWYFMKDRGEAIGRYWDMIPNGIDMLVTHGPPKGFGDWSPYDHIHAGDDDLLNAIKRVKPKLHCAGHFHSGRGSRELTHEDGSKTIILNATVVNEAYNVVHAPWVLSI